jgi:triosephosphate isomerase (TIM)
LSQPDPLEAARYAAFDRRKLEDARAGAEAIAASVKATPLFADILICLPATLIAQAAETAAGRIAIDGEDCSAEIAGAFTGDISAEMLKGAGASAVIVGHQKAASITMKPTPS